MRNRIGPATRRPAALLATVAAFATAMVGSPLARAADCPDIEVVFARGTTEAPGVGYVGQAFVDALQSQVGPQRVDVYPVAYPATTDWPTAADGVIDASNRIRTMAGQCPKTKMVLGGYSQGAAVMGYVTADQIPPGYIPPVGITGPMAPKIADNVAAVALFGEPSSRFLDFVKAPPIVIGSLYAPKTINQCIVDDPICTNDGTNISSHSQYVANGMVDQAATFAAQKLDSLKTP